jgi:hypothetical protein
MDALIGVIIFIVVVVLSLASKAQEARQIAERQREKEQRKPQQLSGKARQQIHGRVQPQTATAREGQSPPPVPPQRPVRKPRPVEQELLETLFGVKLNRDADENAQRETVREPRVREATQQMVQRLRGESAAPRPAQTRPAQTRRAPARAATSGDDEGPTVTIADIRAKKKDFERQFNVIRERMHHGMRQGLAQTTEPRGHEPRDRQRQVQRKPAAKPVQPVRRERRPGARLFENAHDVRRAIIVSEVLGRPKSMRDESAA